MSRTKAILLRDEIDRDFHSLDYVKIPPYLSILLDQYGDSPEAVTFGRTYYGDYGKLKDSTQAPAFSVSSLSGPKRTFTNTSFKGKYCLLYFWATWNKPSVDELENVGKAYKKYSSKGLRMLSISVDSTREDISRMKHSREKTPWMSAIVKGGLDSKTCKDFAVYSVPKSVLVDPDGKIAAAGWELRGENLGKTLAKYLGK
jgi:peroxiredoxin